MVNMFGDRMAHAQVAGSVERRPTSLIGGSEPATTESLHTHGYCALHLLYTVYGCDLHTALYVSFPFLLLYTALYF